jgi:hypothetical protein
MKSFRAAGVVVMTNIVYGLGVVAFAFVVGCLDHF